MKKFINPKKEQWSEILERPTQTFDQIESTVAGIFKEISLNGDAAVRKYVKQFDEADLSSLTVSKSDMDAAEDQLSKALKSAIKLAKANIEAFHSAQKTEV